MQRCPQCQAECSQGEVSCSRCGTRVASAAASGGGVAGIIIPPRAASQPQHHRATAVGDAISSGRDVTLQAGSATEVSGSPVSGRAGPSDAQDKVGSTLGSYRLIKVLGEGGMGCVYLAEHTRLGRKVALKTVRPEYAQNPQVVHRFFAEARAVNKISHDHIVEITDFVENVGGDNYFIMEHLKGMSLGELTRRDGIFPLPRSIGIAAQVCSALAAVHDAGIIHRDLKPDNIFITERSGQKDFVKILDFGVAKLMDIGEGGAVQLHQTAAGVILGTPDYMSPEQACSRATDYRTDIYSLGVILYELCCGKKPLEATSFGDMIVKHSTEPPVPPRQVKGLPHQIPGSLERLIMHCLEKVPQNRPAGMREIEQRLRQIAASETFQLEVFDPATGVTRKAPPDRRPIKIAGAVVGVAAIAAIVIGLIVGREPEVGTIRIESVPPGAHVSVDGKDLGVAPITLKDVDVGSSRKVALTLDGYEPSSASARVDTGGQTVPVLAVLRPLHGSLEVSSRPPGGAIALDGVALGLVTPTVIEGVSRGKHEVVVTLAGHVMDKEIVDVGAERARADLELVPRVEAPVAQPTPPVRPVGPRRPPAPVVPRVVAAFGTLDLETRPYTTVYLGKRKLGDTPLIGVKLPAGIVNLTLVNEAAGIREAYTVKITKDEKLVKKLKL